jgi:hypothetical protein
VVSKPVDSARAPDLKPCEACGHHHGSVGAHIECLNGHIRFLRERIAPRQYTDEDADNADPTGMSRPSRRR